MSHRPLRALPLLVLVALLCTGCQNPFSSVQKETTEAVNNLKNDALNVKEGVDNKIDQVNTAVQSVKDAANSVDKAVQDIKTATGSTPTQ